MLNERMPRRQRPAQSGERVPPMSSLPLVQSLIAASTALIQEQIDALEAKRSTARQEVVSGLIGKEVVAVLSKGRVRKATIKEVLDSQGSRLRLTVEAANGETYEEVAPQSRVRALFSEEALEAAVAYKLSEAAAKDRSPQEFEERAQRAEAAAIEYFKNPPTYEDSADVADLDEDGGADESDDEEPTGDLDVQDD